ncbi:MAG: MFS transporter [Deltaproteobacteria bacterium]|nr:MFS transporter [Deltaproteobacteria bacterium]
MRDSGPGTPLPAEYLPTFRRHLVYALLNAAAAGILANAPMMALKALSGPSWQMVLQMTISSIGMFLVLYLGGAMAERPKMPWVVVPGLVCAGTCFGMAMTRNVFLFLTLSGLGALFENVASPAMTAIIRSNYPATHRGAATGTIRGWCSVTFLASCLLSAWLLDQAPKTAERMIPAQLAAAGALWAIGVLAFSTIRVRGEVETRSSLVQGLGRPLREAWDIGKRDDRFRRYLGIGLLYSFGGMIFASFIPVLATKDLKCTYLVSTLLVHGIPGIVAFFSTGIIGRWIDRTNPWQSWRWIRLGWGLDPLLLAATPAIMAWSPPMALAVASLARVVRGTVMGGSWILWWQLGVNHFAPLGSDTARYQGMVLFINGFARLLGPLVGAWVLLAGRIEGVFVLGGLVVLLSALLSSRELARERKDARLATMARFEAQGAQACPESTAPSPTQQ